MNVRALRGVCIGVDRHLRAGDSADLDPAMVTFLVGIGAVERIDDMPAVEPQTLPDEKPAPGKPGKKER